MFDVNSMRRHRMAVVRGASARSSLQLGPVMSPARFHVIDGVSGAVLSNFSVFAGASGTYTLVRTRKRTSHGVLCGHGPCLRTHPSRTHRLHPLLMGWEGCVSVW